MEPPRPYELMAGCLRRMASGPRADALLGNGRGRAEESFLRLAPLFERPVLYVDLPLTGEPRVDLHVGFSRTLPAAAEVLSATSDGLPDALRWAREGGFERNLLFPVDADAPMGRVSGVYLRHSGDLRAARRFLELAGAAGLTEGYLKAAGRLPRAWGAMYAGHYLARGTEQVRMEVLRTPDPLRALAEEEGALQARLSQTGYTFVGREMLGACMELVSLGLPATLQFDVRADGTLAPTASLTVSFERLCRRASAPLAPGGQVARVLGTFRRLGAADSRADLLAGTCLARRVRARDGDGTPREVGLVCLPACAKLKWEAGELKQAKWYQVIRTMPLGADHEPDGSAQSTIEQTNPSQQANYR